MSTTCSCTECIYNPKPNKQTSKIDKLYRSKYLPRRKRALLEQLVKTRAAYDELRDQILFGRTDDVDSEYGSYRSDDFDKPDKSVVKIVDLVDKGQFPLLQSSVNLHSECCECCYCSSKIKLNKHREAHHALPTDTKLRKNLELRKNKARKDKNTVQFRGVRSEPCICTLKFNDLKNIPRKIRHISSKDIVKKKHKESVECECIVDDYESSFETETLSIFKKTRNKIKESLSSFKTHVTSKEIFKRKPKEFKKPVECECIVDDDEYSFAIESPSKFKKTRNKIRDSLRLIETSSKELYQNLKQKRRKHEIGDFEFFEEYYKKPSLVEKSKMKIKLTRDKFKDGIRSSVSKLENAFRIKKDSIMLFREKLKRKKALKAWTCDPDFCIPNMDECIPEKCYEKIKVREAKIMKNQQAVSNTPEVESNQSQVSVINIKINPKSQKTETRRKSKKDKVVCACRTKTRSKSSMTNRRRRRTQKSLSDSIISSYNKKTDILSERVPTINNNSQYSMNESDDVLNLPNATSKQAVKISSSFKFEIEFYKDRSPSDQNEPNRTNRENDSQKYYQHYSSRENDKVLKYSNARTQHTIRMQKRSTQTIDISCAEKLPFPIECDPYMCVPGKCDPRKCAAILLKQSQGNHELQRCLCTLQTDTKKKKLRRHQTKVVPCECDYESEKPLVKTKASMTPTVVNYTRLPAQHQNKSLYEYECLPYECEPRVCIPGECNPMICYERIKKCNSIKNRSNTLTQCAKRRDVKSSSATKSRPVCTKVRAPMQRKRLSRQKPRLSPVPVEKSLSSSTALNRQVVRIGSSFKFDIEFYKNTNNPNENVSVPKDHATNDNREEIRNSRSLHTKDSNSTKSEQAGVRKSFLKRCFCTEQFRKKPKVKQIKRRSTMIMTDTNKKKSRRHQTKVVHCDCDYESEKPSVKTRASMTSTVVNYVKPPAQHQNRNLYECEPRVCVPGECNSMICYERIKQRNSIKNRSINTLTQRTKRRDVNSSSTTKSRPVGTKVRAPMQRKKISRQKPGSSPVPVEKSLSSSTTLNRQIVRIGSSFKFDIEFYKNTNNPDENVIVPKDRATNDNREEIRNSRIPHTKDSNSTKSEQAGVRKSFLKRCFCTEQFRKKPKVKEIKRRSTMIMTDTNKKKSRRHQTKVVHCEFDYESEKPSVKTRASMTSTVVHYVKPPAQHQNRNLYGCECLPYECKPFFCTPGKCDPNVCLQRIKSQNIKRTKIQSTRKGTMSNKTTSLVTPIGNKNSSRKVQIVRADRRKKIGHYKGVHDRKVDGSHFDKKEAYMSKSSSTPPKQGFKVGSSFHFDIEFYKTNTYPVPTILENTLPSLASRSRIKKGVSKINRNVKETNFRKLKSKTRSICDCPEVKSQTSGTKDSVQPKMSLTASLQRCICTLKFSKKPKRKVKKIVSKLTPVSKRIRMVKCECKVASTQTPKQTGKSKLHDDRSYNVAALSNLLPYECEPDFCVPKKCDPYACYERTKCRNLLKKCFCTLKFNKSSKNQGIATHLKKVKRTAGTETVQEKHQRHNLLPYECSPGFCDPGNCNSYKCLELIKKRNALNISHRDQFASTNRPVRKLSFNGTPRIGKRTQSTLNISEHGAHKDKNSKSKKNLHRRHNNALNNENTLPSTSLFSTPSKLRQAVRIGSNCSFNIEFSKNKAGKFINASDKKMPQVSRTHIDNSSKLESKRERCFCTLKFHKNARKNRDNHFNNNLEISKKEKSKHRKLGIRDAMEITRERYYKRHRRQRPRNLEMINITEEERYGKQKQTQKTPVLQRKETIQQEIQKPPVEKPKETVQQPQETVLITRELKEIKPEPPPVQYEYVYRTVKYTGEGNAPIVTEVNASQVDVNKLVAAGQSLAK